MADHQEQNPRVVAAALKLQLKVAQEGQARLATELAEAQIANNELANHTNAQANQINTLTQSNVSMLASVNAANEGREEFRTLLSEKIDEEKEQRDLQTRAWLYADYVLHKLHYENKSSFALPFPSNPKQYNRSAVLPTKRMISLGGGMAEVIAFCDELYQNIPTSALQELLKV